jgi:hypothetical protein
MRTWGEKVLVGIVLDAAVSHPEVRAVIDGLAARAELKPKDREAVMWLLDTLEPKRPFTANGVPAQLAAIAAPPAPRHHMTDFGEEFERTTRLLHQLPEKQYALYRLGAALHQSFRLADINNRPDDRAYVMEVAKRIDEVTCPVGRDLFDRWLKPGGALRLWQD